MRQAVVVGGTGLTGSELIAQLVALRHPIPVRALVRRPSDALPAQVEQIVLNHLDLAEELSPWIPKGSWVFCCVGTTMRKAGSQEAFKAVDLDIPVALAHACAEAGAAGLTVVSSAGAKAEGFFFYTRTKGEMELGLQAAGLEALHIFRPGLLVGKRQEWRLGENLAIGLSNLLAPLFRGPLAKYAPVKVDVLVKIMLEKAQKGTQGLRVYEGIKLKLN
jgi:uncharacterized protein YbjT (DUF2867 family)